MTELVTDGLSYWARQAPGRPAIVFDGTDLVDYQSLDRWTDAAARCHLEAGLAAGDRIGIIGDNSLEWVVAAIGALKLGAVVVPFNNRFTPDELAYLVGDCEPAMVLADEVHRDRMAAALRQPLAPAPGAVALRSRWVKLDEGWRVTQVRNIPATPPVMGSAGPRDDGLDRPHWEGLRGGEVRVQRCARCGHWIWAPQPVCPRCHGFELAWPVVEPAGVVYSWTRTWQPFTPELSGHVPFVVVLAELPSAGGRRLLGVLRDGDGAEVRVGQAVRGEIDPAADSGGWPVLCWRLA